MYSNNFGRLAGFTFWFSLGYICLHSQYLPVQNIAGASDVQDFFYKLSKAVNGTALNLHQQIVTSSQVPGHAAPPAWLQAEHISVSKKPLSVQTRSKGLYLLVPPAAIATVHVLKGSCKKLSSEVLQLPPFSRIVLGPDCHNAEFEGVEFKGALLLRSTATYMLFAVGTQPGVLAGLPNSSGLSCVF